jgi:hypothetical protein
VETAVKPRPHHKEGLSNTVDEELNAIKKRSEAEKQTSITRVDEQIKALTSRNPQPTNATEIQKVTSEIENRAPSSVYYRYACGSARCAIVLNGATSVW